MKRFVGFCLLGASLMAPISAFAQPYRYYDRDGRDYHVWNDGENRAYRHWWLEERREHQYRDYRRLRAEQQRDYWRWRHEHSDWR